MKKLFITMCFIFSLVFTIKFCMLVIPVNIQDKESIIICELKREYRITERIAKAIYLAHILSNYNPMFIAELALSESRFDNNAVSESGYKGIMQIPTKRNTEGNIIEGVSILMEKFKIANGDPLKAITLYKGGTPLAERQAREFLAKYERRIN